MIVENLKLFKKKIKKTNHQIADATGYSHNSVQRYFKGDTDPPTAWLQKMNQIYGLNLNWLATGEGSHIDYGTKEDPQSSVKEPSTRFSRWVDILVNAYPRFSEEDKKEMDTYLEGFFNPKKTKE